MMIVITLVLAVALVFAIMALRDTRRALKLQRASNAVLVADMTKAEAEVSQASIASMLDERGVSYDFVDGEICFNHDKAIIAIYFSESPKINIASKFALKSIQMDWDCLCRAANEVADDIEMVNVFGVKDEFIGFDISFFEHSIGHFSSSLDDYVSIIMEARKRLIGKYNEYNDARLAQAADDRYDPIQNMIKYAEDKTRDIAYGILPENDRNSLVS